jgi:hypothetical protein
MQRSDSSSSLLTEISATFTVLALPSILAVCALGQQGRIEEVNAEGPPVLGIPEHYLITTCSDPTERKVTLCSLSIITRECSAAHLILTLPLIRTCQPNN